MGFTEVVERSRAIKEDVYICPLHNIPAKGWMWLLVKQWVTGLTMTTGHRISQKL
jgi:hypothetical protein